ncbi:MAG: error-prone DNA polymerase [Myxococcota bacterium]
MTSPPYIELGVRSAFSFLEGSSAPEDLLERAAELGHGTLALADVHGVYGLPRFARAARASGVSAIVGARAVLLGEGKPRRISDPPPDGGRVMLIVKTRAGYRNLCRLLTLGHARCAKPESRVTWDELRAHADGLVAVVREPALAEPVREIFGEDAYGELWRHRDPDEERANRRLVATGIAPLATGDVRHARPAGKRLLDAFTCIAHGAKLDDAGRLLLPNAERHVHTPAGVAKRFADLPEALTNTLAVAERCVFRLEDLGYAFPDFPLGRDETLPAKLRELAFAGARQRYGGKLPAKARAQLEHELGTISRLALEGYFLIVWDIVRECRARGILCQGRGSAANSIVCYALGITAIDPVRYELLFERFLSEERGEWPDIDVDLPSGDHREEILQYVYQRYGPHGAGMTANVITYRAKSAVREMGKVLGLAAEQIERLAKLMSRHEFTDEHDLLERQLRESGVHPHAARVRHLVRLVHEAQNLPRHLGQHSGGMVIAQGRLDEVVPLEPARMPGRSVIQWDKDDCADLGIIKIDLLGLGMMAVLEEVIPLVRAHDGADVDLAKIPADDPKTYAMLQKADTVGVFQVESRAQMATLPRMKPTSFYDLVVEVAIIRPGPVVGQMVQPYLQRRAGREPVTYAHPLLEPILARTLGVPLFQEQLLRMAMTVASFSGGQAEELRRAMGFKRSADRMASIITKLRDGMTQNGVELPAQEEIVKQIGSFALYGFPESHAASFALLAYASAYIRAHHPACFLTAMLNHWPLGFYSPATLVQDSARHGVRTLPIDVQESDWLCHVTEAKEVRLGLRYVDGLRVDAGERIAAESPYESLGDLAQRAALHRDELEKLASVGACASLGLERREALWQVAALSGGLLSGATPTSPSPLPEMTGFEATVADYQGTGITTGAHLMSHFRERLRARGVLSSAELREARNGAWVRIAGAVIVRQRPGSAKGFLFITLEDETGTSNAIVVPDMFQRHRALVQTAGLMLIEGPVQSQDGVIHVRARRFERLDGDTMAGLLPRSHDFR